MIRLLHFSSLTWSIQVTVIIIINLEISGEMFTWTFLVIFSWGGKEMNHTVLYISPVIYSPGSWDHIDYNKPFASTSHHYWMVVIKIPIDELWKTQFHGISFVSTSSITNATTWTKNREFLRRCNFLSPTLGLHFIDGITSFNTHSVSLHRMSRSTNSKLCTAAAATAKESFSEAKLQSIKITIAFSPLQHCAFFVRLSFSFSLSLIKFNPRIS